MKQIFEYTTEKKDYKDLTLGKRYNHVASCGMRCEDGNMYITLVNDFNEEKLYNLKYLTKITLPYNGIGREIRAVKK